MKKLMLAVATAAACGSISLAHAASSILFDQSGAGGPGVLVDSFDWGPGNALVVGAFSSPVVDALGRPSRLLVAQGKLSVFVGPGPTPIPVTAGHEFTYQVTFWESAIGLGTGSTQLLPDPSKPSSFKVFYDTNPLTFGNDVTGSGYGDGLVILTGQLSLTAGSFGSFLDQTTNAGAPIVKLDQQGTDNAPGVLTRQGSGSTKILIDGITEDTNFFRSNITSLSVDMQDTTTNAVPFDQANPSDMVMGIIPSYSLVGGVKTNGDNTLGVCTGGAGQDENGNPGGCDLHLQTDAVTSFNPTSVPEPGSLALVGLALGGLGLIGRRRVR